MSPSNKIVMSPFGIFSLEIIQKVTEKRMKQHQAAEQLNLTTRQIKRFCKTFNEIGAPGLVSKLRGKPSKRCIKLTLKQQIIDFIIKHYQDFGPTLAAEKHEINVSVETVRKIMLEAHI